MNKILNNKQTFILTFMDVFKSKLIIFSFLSVKVKSNRLTPPCFLSVMFMLCKINNQ